MSNPFWQQIIAMVFIFSAGVHVERGDFNSPFNWFGLMVAIALALLVVANAKRSRP